MPAWGPDPIALMDFLQERLYAVQPALVNVGTDEGTVYTFRPPIARQGLEPWAVISAPTNSYAHRLSGESGSIANRPNVYAIYYLETRYVADAAKKDEQRRAIATYEALAADLVSPDGGNDDCPPGDTRIVSVRMETKIEGPYVKYGGDEWIGVLIFVEFEELG